jgi:cytochrome b
MEQPTSRAEPESAASDFQRVLVWDAPTRVFHWLMVACFTGACLTAGQEDWRTVHAASGYTMVGLVAFRVLWGFAGTRHARFASFIGGPKAIASYLRQMPHGWGKRHIGHSPAGGLSIIALLLLTLVVGASGWATHGTHAAGRLGELHEVAAHALLAVVGLHIAGVAFSSWRAGESLLISMIIGTRLGSAGEAIRSARHRVALLLAAAVLGFWWYQWRSAAAAASAPEQPAAAIEVRREPDGSD